MTKREILPLALLATVMLLVSSCLSNDDGDITYADDTAITSFTLGTLNQYLHATSSKGVDSVYKKTVDCSTYKFCIDHKTRSIYNPDSLPYGTDASRVICTVATRNSGTVLIKSATSDTLSYYSSSDSIDFTTPRELQVYSNSGLVSRRYTVRVNVHRETPDSFRWTRLAQIPELAALEAMRAVSAGGTLYVLGQQYGATLIYRTTDGTRWTACDPGRTLSAQAYTSTAVIDGSLCIADGGDLITTADGQTWTVLATATPVSRLLGATAARLYAYSADGSLIASADHGATWTASPLDDDRTLLPTQYVSSTVTALKTNAGASRLLLIGARDLTAWPADTHPVIWGKTDETAAQSHEQPWAYYDLASDNHYAAPLLTDMQTAAYDDAIYLMGGASLAGAEEKPFSHFWKSRDGGITWQTDTVVTMPQDLVQLRQAYAFTSDDQGCVWLVSGFDGSVWRGRINRLGWKKEQDTFTE